MVTLSFNAKMQGSHNQGKSGKIRENFYFLESQGKSGNFNIFCRESGKVRENDLAGVTQSLSLISRDIFVKTQ